MSGKAPPTGPKALRNPDDSRAGHGYPNSHSHGYSSQGHRSQGSYYGGGGGGSHYGHGGRGQGQLQSPVQSGFNVHSRHSSGASSSSLNSASVQNTRIGTAPPTRPRSLRESELTNGRSGPISPPLGPGGARSGRGSMVNGQSSPTLPQKPSPDPSVNGNANGGPGPSTLLNKMTVPPQNVRLDHHCSLYKI